MTGPAGCEYGPTHWCVMGKHGNCNHRAGGTSARGIWMPECYVTIPPKRGHKGTDPIPDGIEHCLVPYGLAVIRPSHVYRCPCECHTAPAPIGAQLSLFEEVFA